MKKDAQKDFEKKDPLCPYVPKKKNQECQKQVC